MDWQPIETAPKGGIIWLGCDHSLRLGYWRDGKQYEHHGSEGGGWRDFAKSEGTGPSDLHFAPTHWQPIPEPPDEFITIPRLEDGEVR